MGRTLVFFTLWFCSITVCGHSNGSWIVPKLTHDKENQCLFKGGSVTLKCLIGNSSSDWLFFWYKAVPLRDDLPADTHWSGRSTYSLELLPDSSRGARGSYSLNSTGPEHIGLFACRAKREEPVYYTDYSNLVFLYFSDDNSPGRLSISPNRTDYFKTESLSLSCGGNGTGWTLRRITDLMEISQCPFSRGASSWENNTCHISAVSEYDGGAYWCQTESGKLSNLLYVEVHYHDAKVYVTFAIDTMPTIYQQQQYQFVKGEPVKLLCIVQSNVIGWRFLWYRVAPYRDGLPEAPRWDGEARHSLELLPHSIGQAEGTYTLSSAAPEHSGLYVCGAERGEPVYITYSSPTFIWIKDPSPPAFLHIQPSRQQYLEGESISLSCEMQANDSGWILKKYRHKGISMSFQLETESSGQKAVYNIVSLNSSHDGNYWCQSESGELSNILSIQVEGRITVHLHVTPDKWLTAGDSVSLRCSVYTPTSGTSWKFLWFKLVPYREELPTFIDKYTSSKYSLELLPDNSSGDSYTLSSVGPEHSGLYVCRGEREQSVYHTAYSEPKLISVIDPSPEAALIIKSNRTQYIQSESVSLSCVAQDSASGWSLRRYLNSYPASLSGCPFNNTVTWDQSTCNISSLSVSDSGVYWCQSESGLYSNAVKITVNYGPRPVLHASPSTWADKGDTVTLKCEISESSSGWRFYFYKLIAPVEEVLPSENDKFFSHELKISDNCTELLSNSSREAGGSYTFSSVGPEHTGIYVCRAQRLNSTYYTQYSYLKHLWVTDPSPPASVSIHPNWSPMYEFEFISLTCEVRGNSSGWTLRHLKDTKKASHCAFKHGLVTWEEKPCNLRLRTEDSGQYWCQSESGEYSNSVNISVHGQPTPHLQVTPSKWETEGSSLTLTCTVRGSTTGWSFLWYKVIPPRKGLRTEFHSLTGFSYSLELLEDTNRGAGGLYSLNLASPAHSGVYLCRAQRGDPAYYTQYSPPQLVWITSSSPSAWLSVSPNRSDFSVSQSLSLSCKVLGNTTEWTVRRYTSTEGLSDCPFNSRSGTWAESVCNISALADYDSGVYWCQSTSGELSNPVNITVHHLGNYVSWVEFSPNPWVTEGSPVTLSCSLFEASSTGVRFHWYKAVPVQEGLPLVRIPRSRETKYSAELLSDSSRGAGGSYTLTSSTPEHSGPYFCRAEIEKHAIYAEFSQPALLTVTGHSPCAWLDVSPRRSQHFVSEPLTLTCKTQDVSTVWSVRRFTTWKELSDCPFNKKSELLEPSTCNISSLTLSDSGVYWCQSESGKHSNAVNITVHNGNVLLDSPTHSLIEGETVELHCLSKGNSESHSIKFYKDRLLVQKPTSGTMTIPNISKRDEGLYTCEDKDKRSPGSWVSVRDAPGKIKEPLERLKAKHCKYKDIL